MVLPRSMRIKGHRCFDHIHRTGKRYYGKSMVLRVAAPKPELLKKKDFLLGIHNRKCAVTISNKVSKKAVIRNRLRRMLHIHLMLRLHERHNQANYWALITLKPSSSNAEFQKTLQECDTLLKAAGLLR